MRLQKIHIPALPGKGPCNNSDLACLDWPTRTFLFVTMDVKTLKLYLRTSYFNASKRIKCNEDRFFVEIGSTVLQCLEISIGLHSRSSS